jgi:serine/threonine protein kinase
LQLTTQPDNILFGVAGDYGTLKLADFGWSKAFLHPSERFGTNAGTPECNAPEVLILENMRLEDRKDAYTVAADVWSVGATLYFSLNGFAVPPNWVHDLKQAAERALETGRWGPWAMPPLPDIHPESELARLIQVPTGMVLSVWCVR